MPIRPPRRLAAALLAAALFTAVAALPVAAVEPPAEWAAVAGAAHVLDDQRTGMGGVEARWGLFRLPLAGRHLPIEPALGLTANGDGGTYAYLSFRLDVAETLAALAGDPPPPPAAERPWRLVGYTGLGHYRPGDEGRELGGPLEFRSGLELSRRLGPRTRLGLSFDHLSNAGIYDHNPGSESLVLVLSWRPGAG
jgi:hypothetical protein